MTRAVERIARSYCSINEVWPSLVGLTKTSPSVIADETIWSPRPIFLFQSSATRLGWGSTPQKKSFVSFFLFKKPPDQGTRGEAVPPRAKFGRLVRDRFQRESYENPS